MPKPPSARRRSRRHGRPAAGGRGRNHRRADRGHGRAGARGRDLGTRGAPARGRRQRRSSKGQVLAELDGEPQRLAVASARASVERLEALLANQQRTVKRYQELRSKAVSESMLEEAIAQQSAREAELNDARARLAEAEYRLDRTRIKSPGGRDRRAAADLGRRLRLARHAGRHDRRHGQACAPCCPSRSASRASCGPGSP
jgi:hypothetical protein